MMKSFILLIASFAWSLATFSQAPLSGDKMVPIAGGSFTPLYTIDSQQIKVEPFLLDAFPVTNQQYLEFINQHPKWQPHQIAPLFADEGYLRHFTNGLDTAHYTHEFLKQPVTNVSWFTARAYCKREGKRLPTTAEWEYAALASPSDPQGFNQQEYYQIALDWYARTSARKMDTVGSTFENYYGAYDLHGLIWEWVNDFNSSIVFGSDQRNQKIDKNLFCAAGALGAADVKNYVAFMRYAFRSSLEANYTVGTLGFRCAQNIQP